MTKIAMRIVVLMAALALSGAAVAAEPAKDEKAAVAVDKDGKPVAKDAKKDEDKDAKGGDKK